MAEMPDRTSEITEMDLGHVLRILFRQKWALAGFTLLVGAAAACYSLTKPNIYESEAALIVREPQQPIQQNPEEPVVTEDVPSVSVETLQMLSESTETIWLM